MGDEPGGNDAVNSMLEPASIKKGALIELRDAESGGWLPLTIEFVSGTTVACRTLADEPILTTTAALIKDARLRPRDGSCRDCGDEAHQGSCIERRCSECGAEVSSRCSQHPQRPVHVYRRQRYLAEIVEDKPYPTRDQAEALRRDLLEQMRVLRDAEEPRQGRVMIRVTERSDILSAIENAMQLIDSLPSAKRRS
jgi:hypothetical protein